MKIIRAKDYYDMSRKAANIISAQVIMKPNCVLGLATGGTPVGTYKQLVEWYNKGDIDFSEVTTVNWTSTAACPRSTPRATGASCTATCLTMSISVPRPSTCRTAPTWTPPPSAARYDAVIHNVGGIDLQLLGIGQRRPHRLQRAGNEAFELGTHCVDLKEETIEANKRFFDGNADLVPKQAYTMGIKTIMQARKVLMVANGKGKADIVKKAFFGPVTPEVPASILQMHPDFILVGDEEALSEI